MLSLSKHLYRTVDQIQVARLEYFGRLSMFVLLATTNQLASAQQPTPRIYTYVEQMPQLPSGGGTQAIANELLKQMRYPTFSIANGQWPESRVKISFVVAIDGSLQDVKLLASSHNADIDKALLSAPHSLPRLLPGYQDGQPVRVQLTFPITLEYR